MHGIDNDDWPYLAQLLRMFREGKLIPPAADVVTHRPQPSSSQTVVALLRDRLEGTGTVQAEVLEYRPDSGGVDVQVVGFHDAGRPFRLEFVPGTLNTGMTAAQFRAVLAASQYGKFLQDVTIGNEPGVITPMRWRIQWATPENMLLAPNVDWIRVTPCHYHGTGRTIDVSCPLIFDTVTPLRSGSQVVCQRMAGVGWIVIAAEPRQFVVGDANAFPV